MLLEKVVGTRAKKRRAKRELKSKKRGSRGTRVGKKGSASKARHVLVDVDGEPANVIRKVFVEQLANVSRRGLATARRAPLGWARIRCKSAGRSARGVQREVGRLRGGMHMVSPWPRWLRDGRESRKRWAAPRGPCPTWRRSAQSIRLGTLMAAAAGSHPAPGWAPSGRETRCRKQRRA